jgi:hypothetical protein
LSGKFPAKVIGLRVTRMLRSPAARTSSCAGCPAAVIDCPSAGAARQQRGRHRNLSDEAHRSLPLVEEDCR